MKIKRIILWTLGILFLALLFGGLYGINYFKQIWFKERPDYLTFTTDFEPIQFKWTQGTYGDYIEKHDIIKVPVKVKGLPHRFYFQLDTGAPTTLLYGNPLKILREMAKELNITQKGESSYLDELQLNMGGSEMRMNSIKVYTDYGGSFNKEDTLSNIKIGSLGADFFNKHLTEIDFKNQFVQFYKERQSWMTAEQEFVPFSFEGRRFMLPCRIEGKDRELFYDSGSSAFGLITIKGRYQKYADKDAPEIFYDASSWGNSMSIKHRATSINIEMAGLEIPLKRVSYVDMYANLQGFITPFTRIGGWMGNKPFTEYSMIIDAAKEEFMVLKK